MVFQQTDIRATAYRSTQQLETHSIVLLDATITSLVRPRWVNHGQRQQVLTNSNLVALDEREPCTVALLAGDIALMLELICSESDASD